MTKYCEFSDAHHKFLGHLFVVKYNTYQFKNETIDTSIEI